MAPSPPAESVRYFVGGGFGAAQRVATYDDGFQVRGVTGLFAADAGARVSIGNGVFLGARFTTIIPFSGSDREYATTRLNWSVMPEAEISVDPTLWLYGDYAKARRQAPTQPVIVFATVGPAIAGLSSGSNYPGFSWSNQQTAVGITASAGIEVPVASNISLVGQFRYMGFPQTRFDSPFGSFKRDENLYIGTIAVKFTFN